MLFVLCLSAALSFITSLLTRLLLDPRELARKQEIIKEHQDQKKALERMKEENPKKYQKEFIRWKRREKAVQKMQQSMSFSRMKPTCITLVPTLVLFFVLNSIYGGLDVALPPMSPYRLISVPIIGTYLNSAATPGWISFITWYWLCSLSTGSIIQRLLGVAQQTSFTNLFGQQQAALSMGGALKPRAKKPK